MQDWSVEHFAPLQGQHFALSLGEAQEPLLSAELVQAQALPQPVFKGRQPFSLLFAGPPAPLLPQRIYRLAHAQLPPMDIFLVPRAADATQVHYQAVFG